MKGPVSETSAFFANHSNSGPLNDGSNDDRKELAQTGPSADIPLLSNRMREADFQQAALPRRLPRSGSEFRAAVDGNA